MPLDPYQLTPSASLNRLRIVDLPGVAVDPDVRGKTGYDLLSASALADCVCRYAVALGLGSGGEDVAAVLQGFDRCLASDDPAIRSTAEGIAARFGRRLSYLIQTLQRGD